MRVSVPSGNAMTRLRRCVVLFALSLLVAGPADAAGRHASMAIDANTGQTLHEQAADEPRYPASLTKMMTLYVVFDLMEQGRLSSTTRIRVSETAAQAPPTKLGIAAGGDLALVEAIKAVVVHSANDIAVALAEHIAGSEAAFADLMTRKARQIGMTKTTFRNAHGLPNPEQQTTARDMLTLALRLNDDFPAQYKFFSTRSMHAFGRMHRNHNTMLSTYGGMDGIKTGYIRASGFNLVASVRRDGRHVVAVVFGGTSAAARNVYMRAILDRALVRANPQRTRAKTQRSPVAGVADRRQKAATLGVGQPRLLEAPRPAARPTARVAGDPQPPVARSAITHGAAESSAPPGFEVARVRPVLMPSTAAERRGQPLGPPPGASQATPARDPGATEGRASRGSLPSSLEDQAQRLAGAPSAAVQVGAFATEAEARQKLAATRQRFAVLLVGAEGTTQLVTAGTRQLWRARFVGLDEKSAADACYQLRLAQLDCLVARTP